MKGEPTTTDTSALREGIARIVYAAMWPNNEPAMPWEAINNPIAKGPVYAAVDAILALTSAERDALAERVEQAEAKVQALTEERDEAREIARKVPELEFELEAKAVECRITNGVLEAAQSRIQALTEGLERAAAILDDLPKMPKAYAWTGAGSDMFDNELRHANGSKPIDFLRGWLSIFRQFGYATRDESWGELEKLISIVMRNYGEFAEGVRKARVLLRPTPSEQGGEHG